MTPGRTAAAALPPLPMLAAVGLMTVAAPVVVTAQEPAGGGRSPGQANGASLLAPAESLLASGDTLAAESSAAAVLHAAHGRDVQAYLSADRFLLEIATARSATDPELAESRYKRLTGRAEAESLYAVDMERRRDELRRLELMTRATDVDSLVRQLDSLGLGPARDAPVPGAAGQATTASGVDAAARVGAGFARSAAADPLPDGSTSEGPPANGSAGTTRALVLGGAAVLAAGAIALRRRASADRRRRAT